MLYFLKQYYNFVKNKENYVNHARPLEHMRITMM